MFYKETINNLKHRIEELEDRVNSLSSIIYDSKFQTVLHLEYMKIKKKYKEFEKIILSKKVLMKYTKTTDSISAMYSSKNDDWFILKTINLSGTTLVSAYYDGIEWENEEADKLFELAEKKYKSSKVKKKK